MAITWANVKEIAPGDGAIQAFADPASALVTLAYAQLNAKMWTRNNPTDTALLDLGARYLAAHMFTVGNKSGGSGGPTSTEKVGDVTRVMNVMQEDPAWDSTPYGRSFKQLFRTLNIESRWLPAGTPNLSTPLPFGGRRFIP